MAAKPDMTLLQRRPRLHLALCTAGIVLSLLAYSVLQERIMTQPFGAAGEHFRHSLFLVLVNRVVTFSSALLTLLASGGSLRPVAPPASYALVSLSNVAATACQYEALKHVSFPVQTLGKCAKMVPVMAWGGLMLRKRYRPRDYALALAVTLGCSLFLSSGEVSSRRAGAARSSLWGVLLMGGYLACDGFTSTFQSRLFSGFQMSVANQTLYTAAISAAFSLTGLASSSQLLGALAFLRRQPQSLGLMLALSAAATSGQLCIVHTIKAHGPLAVAAVMALRQFLSVLLSCLLFAHPLTLGQWAGTGLVFAALFTKSLAGSPGGRPAGPQKRRDDRAQ